MHFEYKIMDGEVTITGYSDKSVTSLIIPEFIENLPVTNIGNGAFYNCYSLTDINGFKLNESINLINNRFIYHYRVINKIKYQIGDDYICEHNNGYTAVIDNAMYFNIDKQKYFLL